MTCLIMVKKRVLITISSCGFNPTEVVILWKSISQKDIEIVFITQDAKKLFNC